VRCQTPPSSNAISVSRAAPGVVPRIAELLARALRLLKQLRDTIPAPVGVTETRPIGHPLDPGRRWHSSPECTDKPGRSIAIVSASPRRLNEGTRRREPSLEEDQSAGRPATANPLPCSRLSVLAVSLSYFGGCQVNDEHSPWPSRSLGKSGHWRRSDAVRQAAAISVELPCATIRTSGGAAVAITNETQKRLWARSGNRCALCRKELVRPDTDGLPGALVGQEAHIVARSQGGPRYEPLPLKIRDGF
jgi:hypothetical protein